MGAQKTSKIIWHIISKVIFLLFLASYIFNPATAKAKTERQPSARGWEIRLGFYNHGLDSLSFVSKNKEGGFDFNSEILAPPLPYKLWPQNIRPRLGTSISLLRKTDLFYAGLTFEIFDIIAPFFITLGLDIAVHTGRRENNDDGFNALGCRWLLHESASLGLVFGGHHRIMTTIEHASNAKSIIDACPENTGLTNVGIRYGYRF